MTIDGWLIYYGGLPGYTVIIVDYEDGPFWAAFDADDMLVDWWFLADIGAVRPIYDPLTPPGSDTLHE